MNNNINFKLRYDCRTEWLLQFKELQINLKKISDFNGIQSHGLCVRAAMLYQLSYEDPYIGSRPICWVHLNAWMEWNIEWRWHSKDSAVGTYYRKKEWRDDRMKMTEWRFCWWDILQEKYIHQHQQLDGLILKALLKFQKIVGVEE